MTLSHFNTDKGQRANSPREVLTLCDLCAVVPDNGSVTVRFDNGDASRRYLLTMTAEEARELGEGLRSVARHIGARPAPSDGSQA